VTSRPSTDGYLTCYRCGADVADGAAFCAVCGAPQQVARPMSRKRERQPAWVPLAIIGGGIAAIAAGVLVAILLGGGPDDGTAGTSASPSQSASTAASASSAPSESAEPTPTAEPTPDTAVIIPNLGIAAVVTDVLNIRSQPSDGASLVAALETDRRLFIIGEPTEADDLRWYRVATVATSTCPGACDLIGYVATPIAAGDPWISEVVIDCPTSPMTIEDLAALAPLEALHCFGRNEIVVTGTIADPLGGYESPVQYSPIWLAHPFAPPYFLATTQSVGIGFHPHPDSDLEPPEGGDVVRVTGHYEDPAAPSCRAFVDPEVGGDAANLLPNPAFVVLTCRATLAWTDYEVIGHEEVGP
jgi:hypothetical protein